MPTADKNQLFSKVLEIGNYVYKIKPKVPGEMHFITPFNQKYGRLRNE
jgi:hypothetical protein